MDYNITYRNKDKGIQVIVSYKKDGLWKQKAKQGFTTQKAAKKYAEKLLDELRDNILLNIVEGAENLTIGELKHDFLKHIETHREHSTFLNYSQSLNFFPIDNIEVSKLKLLDVQKCVDKLVDKVSLSTIQRRITIFKCMLNFANKQYNIPVVSLKNLTLPSEKRLIEKRALTYEESSAILDFYRKKGGDYYIVVLIALNCGLRIGEIMGLTWNDINFENATLKVNKQWKILKGTKSYGFGDLKSRNSYRTIPIPLSTLEELKLIKNSGVINYKHRLISSMSTYSMSTNLDRQLKRKFNCCIHELRHTYATSLVSNGIDFKTAAMLLGHDIEQTMKTYSHVTDDMIKKATDTINNIYG